MPDVSKESVRHESKTILNVCNEGGKKTHSGSSVVQVKDRSNAEKQSDDSQIKWRGETLKLQVDVMGECVNGVVDSGANSSLLSRRWFEKFLKGKVDLRRDVATIFDMNGNEVNIIGHIITDVCVQGIMVKNCVFYIKESEGGRHGLGKTTKQHCLLFLRNGV